jgi:DNA-binding CsgD family transcriptional regulator
MSDPDATGTEPVSRDGELAALSRLLDDLPVEGGRVALVRGEAGIGKTALVRHFAACEARRALVLVGGCDDLVTPQPFGPVWDVARHDADVASALAEDDSRGVMQALLGLLSRTPRPTVLIVEDTQWADEVTLDAIKFLGRRIARTNGVLVLTYRDGEVDADHPLRQVIGELPTHNLVRITLHPLTSGAVAVMTGGRRAETEAIVALTGGNPLFVTEVIASGTDAVPSSVQDSVLARTQKLSPGAKRLLQLVAVIPGRAERSFLDRALDPAARHMTECERQGLLVVDQDAVSFRHELQRRAVESALPAEQRRELHRLVLDTLAGQGDPARLVHHARQAGDVEALVAHAPKAARAAVAIDSNREAVAHFRALGPYVGRLEPAHRAALLEDWARSEHDAGEANAVELVTTALELRRSLGDATQLARTLTFAVSSYGRNALTAQAEACATEAVAILESRPPSSALSTALTQQAWLWFMLGSDDRRATSLVERALDIAEDVGDELAAVRAMTWKGAIAHNTGDPAGFRLVEEAHRRAASAGFRHEETIALVNLAGMSGDVRSVARAADLARRARDTAARYEIRRLETYAQAMHAEILLWQGQWALAEDTASGALVGDVHGASVAWRILALLQARRGSTEALSTVERMWTDAERTGELQQLDPAASVLAEYTWLVGDRDEGRLARITATAGKALKSGPPWPSGAFVFWLSQLGLLEEIPEHTAPEYRAMLEGQPQVAAELWRSRGVPYEEGLALMHGDEQAQLRAVELFEQLGATATAGRVRQSLREQGVRVPRGRSASTRTHAAGLTGRQAEVLELLADGLTNAEIADRLFVSSRTVENHVAAVLLKLDVADRRAAVQLARDRGLLRASAGPEN